jgi:hypothetical protein
VFGLWVQSFNFRIAAGGCPAAKAVAAPECARDGRAPVTFIPNVRVAFLDTTCRVEPRRGHVCALQMALGGGLGLEKPNKRQNHQFLVPKHLPTVSVALFAHRKSFVTRADTISGRLKSLPTRSEFIPLTIFLQRCGANGALP